MRQEWQRALQILSELQDYLVRRGWVLLHNPSQGIAIPNKRPYQKIHEGTKRIPVRLLHAKKMHKRSQCDMGRMTDGKNRNGQYC